MGRNDNASSLGETTSATAAALHHAEFHHEIAPRAPDQLFCRIKLN